MSNPRRPSTFMTWVDGNEIVEFIREVGEGKFKLLVAFIVEDSIKVERKLRREVGVCVVGSVASTYQRPPRLRVPVSTIFCWERMTIRVASKKA